jgi:hypothetical protein
MSSSLHRGPAPAELSSFDPTHPQRRLEIALRRGIARDAMAALAEGADATEPDLVGESPLGACRRREDSDLGALLTRAGASMAREWARDARPAVARTLGERSDFPEAPEDLGLLCAATAGCAFSIRSAIAQGANPNARSPCGTPALHWAIASGKGEAVEALLEQGANPQALGPDGFDAVEFAAHSGMPAPLTALLRLGLSPHARPGRVSPLELTLRGPIPSRPAGVFSNLRSRVTLSTREDCAAALLEAGADARASFCQEPLRAALSLGSLPLTLALLSRGADPNEPISGLAPALFLFKKPVPDSRASALWPQLSALFDAGAALTLDSPNARLAHEARARIPAELWALIEKRALREIQAPAPRSSSLPRSL